jgi:hypothetical protein
MPYFAAPSCSGFELVYRIAPPPGSILTECRGDSARFLACSSAIPRARAPETEAKAKSYQFELCAGKPQTETGKTRDACTVRTRAAAPVIHRIERGQGVEGHRKNHVMTVLGFSGFLGHAKIREQLDIKIVKKAERESLRSAFDAGYPCGHSPLLVVLPVDAQWVGARLRTHRFTPQGSRIRTGRNSVTHVRLSAPRDNTARTGGGDGGESKIYQLNEFYERSGAYGGGIEENSENP